MITEKEQRSLIHFIYSREQPEGGFSFSQTTPPTLEDTYFALRLLEELDESSISKSTVLYLTSLNPTYDDLPKHLYQLSTIYRVAHLQDYLKIIREIIVSNNNIIPSTIADLYFLVFTKELLHIPIITTRNEQQILTAAQKQSAKSMEEYTQFIIIMKKLHIFFQTKKYADTIQKSQNHDGGFGLIPHSTSFLEPTFHALQALKELHAIPKDIEECKRFVSSCMTRIGGFGRQITTVPSLEYSYYAVISLKIIDAMKNRADFFG